MTLLGQFQFGGRLGGGRGGAALLAALAAAATLAPAALLGVALRENRRAAAQFGEVNRSGSLRFRSLRLYGLAGRGEDGRADFAAMAAVRDGLRARYPREVARTDAAWAALSAQEARTGRADWAAADGMRLAADGLTQAIERRARAEDARASALLGAGIAGLALSLAAALLLARGLARSERGRARLMAEHAAARRALEESQALFLASLNAMREGFAVQDRDGVVLMCNEGADRLLRLAPGEFAGRPLGSHGWRFLREDGADFPRDEHPTRLALATGLPQPETVVGLARPDGPTQWLSIRAAPLCRPGEALPYAAVQTFADVTGRQDAAEALRLAEQRLRSVVDHAPIILFGLDAEGCFTASEGRGLAALGLSPGEVVGRDARALYAGQPEITDSLRRALAGEAVTYVSRVAGLTWENHLTPIAGGAIGVSFDVTARVRAEDALRRGGDRLRRLHDLAAAGGPVADKLDALLRLGREFFGLPVGLLSRADGGRYEILHASAPDGGLGAGHACATGETYCARVLAAGRPLAVAHAGASDWRDLPAYAEHGLECYLGAPLWVDGRTYGTLCFAGPDPRETPFAESDLEILRLMAQWAAGELAREEARAQIEGYNVVLEFQMAELSRANAELAALATLDGLTGISNRRVFSARLEEEVARASRYGLPLSLILLDVDHFKSYNDGFGHPAGDAALRAVARILEQCARETDLVARYGGEEFALLLPQTDSAGAAVVAGRIREVIAQADWPHRPVTASLGVAPLSPGLDGDRLIAQADRALYQSKACGRDRVTVSAGASGMAPAPGG